MTPAPSMPALEALLREVDLREKLENEATLRSGWGPLSDAAPRLAAMLRVAVEGLSCLTQRDSLLEANEAVFTVHAARHMKEQASAALARIEAMAKGDK